MNNIPSHYTQIDSILKYNRADRIYLISTGYAFYDIANDMQTEIELKLKEHNHLSNAVHRYPDKIIPFYGVNPLKPYAIQLLDRCRTNLNFHGVKIHMHASHVDFRKDEHVAALRGIFQYTAQHDIPVLLHFPNHKFDFGDAEVDFFFSEILPQQKSQTLVFAHMGGGGLLKEKDLNIVNSILENSARYPHHSIWFELSGFVNKQYDMVDTVSKTEKLNILRQIGFDRIFFGSDYPLITSRKYFNELLEELNLSRKEKRLLRRTTLPFSKAFNKF